MIVAGLKTYDALEVLKSINEEEELTFNTLKGITVIFDKFSDAVGAAELLRGSLGVCAPENGTVFQLATLPQERRSAVEEGSNYLRNRAESILSRRLLDPLDKQGALGGLAEDIKKVKPELAK